MVQMVQMVQRSSDNQDYLYPHQVNSRQFRVPKSQVQIQIVQMVSLALKDWMIQMVQKFRCSVGSVGLVGSEWSKRSEIRLSESQK